MVHNEISDLIAAYLGFAEGTSDPDPRVANRSHDRLHKIYKRLRESNAGRQAITALVSHQNLHVRCWAAAHSLQWAPTIAREELEALKESKGPCSFDAEITLREFDKGSLSFDY